MQGSEKTNKPASKLCDCEEKERETSTWENSTQNTIFSDCLTHSILIAVLSILKFIYLIFALVNGPHLITIIIIYYVRPASMKKVVCISLAIPTLNIAE